MNNLTLVFGKIEPPKAVKNFTADLLPGLIIDRAVRGLVVIAGLYALINLILAGYAFISAGEDPKKVAGAWAKIYQTLLGLAVAAGAFVLASIFSQLIFNDPLFLLKPKIPTL